MEHGEAEKHLKACQADEGSIVDPQDVWGEPVQAIIDTKAIEIARYREWNQ